MPEKSDRDKTPQGAAKNAKDYYRQLYAVSEQHKQLSSKRKKHGNADEGGRAKKRQAVDNVCTDGTSAASAGMADISVQGFTLDDRDSNEHMQRLKRDVDPGNSQADQDLTELYRSMVSFGHGKCKLVDKKWELDGFGTSLYHHQVIGVSWMLGRELYPTGPRGGILADEMGLGKTVQLLACMSQNLPKKKSRATKTLIIAPKRLLRQWSSEIKSHWSKKKRIIPCIYAANLAATGTDWEDHDIM